MGARCPSAAPVVSSRELRRMAGPWIRKIVRRIVAEVTPSHCQAMKVIVLVALFLAASLEITIGARRAQAVAPPGTWLPTNSMTAVRNSHTATKLQDGRVLVAGGAATPSGQSGSAEIYDDDTGLWTATGSLQVPRQGHQATLLGDGTVLVTGGVGNNMVLSSAETFNPTTGEWQLTGPMGTAFDDGQTATLLGNGKVLVTGTRGFPIVAKTAVLYDPLTRRWSPTGELNIGRYNHTATLLGTGKVLVAGGTVSSTGSTPGSQPSGPTAELYDPSTGSWSLTAPLYTDRAAHSASLLGDGRVLVTGGQQSSRATGTVPSPSLASVELYDPTAGTWTPGFSMAVPRHDQAATVLTASTCGAVGLPPCKILVSGGINGFAELASAELYDPATGQWAPTGSMSSPRSGHTASNIGGGRTLAVGGTTFGEIYFPSTLAPPAVTALSPVAGATTGGTRVTITGERFDDVRRVKFDAQSVAFTVESSTKITASSPAHAVGVVHVSVTTSDGMSPAVDAARFSYVDGPVAVEKIYPPAGPTFGSTKVTISGSNLFHSGSQVRFGGLLATDVIPLSDTELTAVAPAQPQGSVAVTVTNTAGSASSSPGAYRYGAGAWNACSPAIANPACPAKMAADRLLHSATLLDGPACRLALPTRPDYCGKVLVAGGTTDFFSPNFALASAELYDPATGNWAPTGNLINPRFDHSATLLPDGTVLVAGGQVIGTAGSPEAVCSLQTSPGCSAEIYDPASKTWTSTASMSVGRFAHTATLLPNGTVLIAGGTDQETGRPPLASVEIFDPKADGPLTSRSGVKGAWLKGNSLAVARANHTATLVGGTVLVAGGLGSTEGVPDTLSSAELYDLDSGVWRRTADFVLERFSHTATLLSTNPCGSNCGKVLLVGGVSSLPNTGPVLVSGAELFDPQAGTWSAAPPSRARAGHTATMLEDGTVLATGSGMTFKASGDYKTSGAAEVFDPVRNRWLDTSFLVETRGVHTATLLTAPACEAVPLSCGSVLVAGGGSSGVDAKHPPPLRSAELYTPAPAVSKVVASRGPTRGGAVVVVSGAGFRPDSTITFGAEQANIENTISRTEATVRTPAHPKGPVRVVVTAGGQTSASMEAVVPNPYTYVAPPELVSDLVASAQSDTAIRLNFSAPDDGSLAARATRFVVKQSSAAIKNDMEFAAAKTLCSGICTVEAADKVSLLITDLSPDVTYHYALRALNEFDEVGPISNSAEATTDRSSAKSVCPATTTELLQQVRLPAGYSLVGFSEGTVIPSQSPLYGWFDLGANGTYSTLPAREPVLAGRGYWAWFACPTSVEPAVGPSRSARFSLASYHASMVGNPSANSSATVTGHDFAAAWDSTLNGGAGGYRISAYRAPETLAVGQGTWVFSYLTTEVHIVAEG